jgi:hypothetical protein
MSDGVRRGAHPVLDTIFRLSLSNSAALLFSSTAQNPGLPKL